MQNGRITVRRQTSLHNNDPSQSENGSSLSPCLAGRLQLEPCAHLLGLVWFGLVWFGLVWLCVGWLVGVLVGWLVGAGWLVGWCVGWFVCW